MHVKSLSLPWLVWVNGLSTCLQTEGLPVQFPVRVYAWVVGQVPSWGCAKATGRCTSGTSMFVSLSPSLPLRMNK